MFKICAIIGCFLMLILIVLIRYIFNLKKEIGKICDQVSRDEYIYYLDMPDKDVERLAACINEGKHIQKNREIILEKQDKSFKKMVADLSHDLRTPLTVIIGYIQLIRLNRELDAQTQNYIERTEVKANYLKKLIDDLYILFWSEAVDKTPNIESIDIKALTANLLKEYIQNSQRAAESLQISLPTDSVIIQGDEKIFIRILCNLLDNALKYSLGSIRLTMRVEAEYCEIEIENPAEFMDEAELNHIFELFYTKDKARTSSSGMGLYIAKRLAKEIGSDIKAKYMNGMFYICITIALKCEMCR